MQQITPLAAMLFVIAAAVLAYFTLYAHKSGKIRGVYTGLSGALLGVIFAIVIVLFTGHMLMATAVGIVIFGWFLAFSNIKTL